MRSEETIQDRVRHLTSEELDRRVQEATERLPARCKYNHRQPLDTRKHIEGAKNPAYNRISLPLLPSIGLCMYGSEDPLEWQSRICEDPIDAQRCEVFDSIHTKESVMETFQAQIKDPQWVREHMPEVAGLLFALSDNTGSRDRALSLPWWKKLWYRFLRIHPEPLSLPERQLGPGVVTDDTE